MGKRKASDAVGGTAKGGGAALHAGGAKRSKGQWKKQGEHQPSRPGASARLNLNEGLRGVMFTCHVHRQRAAAGEAFEVLRHTLGELRGASGAARGEADDDDAFDAELAALRTERQQLCEVDTGVKGCVLIALRDADAPEPDAVVAKLFEQLQSKGLPPVREVINCRPCAVTCKGRLPEILKALAPLLEPYFGPSAPVTRWNIVFKKRATDPAVLSKEWTITLAALVDARHPVDLKNPEVSVLVDVFRASCGLCVSRHYNNHHQYNCQSKALQPDGGFAAAAAAASAATKGKGGFTREENDTSEVDCAAVEALLAERGVARKAKDWKTADTKLASLHELGVEVTDKERTWRGGGDVELLRRGDWSCPNPECGLNCFASRTMCFKCNTPKPAAKAKA